MKLHAKRRQSYVAQKYKNRKQEIRKRT